MNHSRNKAPLEAFDFDSDGNWLSGILHRPTTGRGDTPELGIIFANAGARGRLGSTFQYPLYAKAFASMGYPCLRFDPHGVGDSEGDIDIMAMPEFYGSLQTGRFVNDTVNAIAEFKKRVGPKKIVLLGICGGAITSLLAAARQPSVDGLILLSVPVLLDAEGQDEVDRLPSGYARQYLWSAYGKKLLSWKAWKRIFSGKSEFSTIFNYGRAALKGLLPQKKGPTETIEKHPMFNEHFHESFTSLVKAGTKILLLFGEGDALRWDFQQQYQDLFWQRDPAYGAQSEIHYLKGCNHLFTLREWQDHALKLAKPWLGAL